MIVTVQTHKGCVALEKAKRQTERVRNAEQKDDKPAQLDWTVGSALVILGDP